MGASFYHSRPPFFWSRNAWAHINGLLWQMVFKNKGKAVAVANSGYTLAEAIMPTIFVALIGFLVGRSAGMYR